MKEQLSIAKIKKPYGVHYQKNLRRLRVRGGHAVIDKHFPYYQRPVTTDGLASYNVLEVRQRCWVHLIRDSDRHVRSVKKRTGASQTDNRDADALHSRFKQFFTRQN